MFQLIHHQLNIFVLCLVLLVGRFEDNCQFLHTAVQHCTDCRIVEVCTFHIRCGIQLSFTQRCTIIDRFRCFPGQFQHDRRLNCQFHTGCRLFVVGACRGKYRCERVCSSFQNGSGLRIIHEYTFHIGHSIQLSIAQGDVVRNGCRCCPGDHWCDRIHNQCRLNRADRVVWIIRDEFGCQEIFSRIQSTHLRIFKLAIHINLCVHLSHCRNITIVHCCWIPCQHWNYLHDCYFDPFCPSIGITSA